MVVQVKLKISAKWRKAVEEKAITEDYRQRTIKADLAREIAEALVNTLTFEEQEEPYNKPGETTIEKYLYVFEAEQVAEIVKILSEEGAANPYAVERVKEILKSGPPDNTN